MKTMRITVKSNRRKVQAVPASGVDAQAVNEPNDVKLYQANDKIVLKETGEVLNVERDLSDQVEPGIVVRERIGRLLLHCEVRPAGRTRERREAAIGVTEPTMSDGGLENAQGGHSVEINEGDRVVIAFYEARIREIEQQKAEFMVECDTAIIEIRQRIEDLLEGRTTADVHAPSE